MSITSHVDQSSGQPVIAISGRFDYTQHTAFRDSYRHLSPGVGPIIVDLTQTTYLDSSALGMLLLIREHAGGNKGSVHLRGCSDTVLRVLKTAYFERLFVIE